MNRMRATQLGPAEVRLLDDWAKALREMFPDALGVLHVGSSLTRADWRDIDVRVVLPDSNFETLRLVMRPRRLNLALTLWGQRVTGLPIDCQIQPLAKSSEYPHVQCPVRPLGCRDSEGVEGA